MAGKIGRVREVRAGKTNKQQIKINVSLETLTHNSFPQKFYFTTSLKS
jgi:hypothetical protein